MRLSQPNRKADTKLFGFTYAIEGKGRAYYFVLVSALKKQLLEARLRQDTAFDVRDYGEIVVSGYGKPTADEMQLLHDDYGLPVEFPV